MSVYCPACEIKGEIVEEQPMISECKNPSCKVLQFLSKTDSREGLA